MKNRALFTITLSSRSHLSKAGVMAVAASQKQSDYQGFVQAEGSRCTLRGNGDILGVVCSNLIR